MENIVVELSRYNSSNQTSNAEWTNNLTKPIQIMQGDNIMVKQAFIDTRLIDQTSILIDQDVEWTLQFIYWITGHGINQFYWATDKLEKSTPDGMPYCLATMYNPTKPGLTPLNPFPLADTFTVKIPRGIYERSYLSEFITKQFEGVNQPQLTALSSIRFGNAQVFPTFTNNTPGASASGYTQYNSIEGDLKVVSPFQKPLICAVADGAIGTIAYPFFYLYQDTTGAYYPAILNQFVNEINGNYAYDSGELITQITTDQIGTMVIEGTNYILYDGGYIGCSQMSLVYNDQNSGKFSFEYMHTPIINEGNECVGNYIQKMGGATDNLDNNVSWFGAHSGIMLINTFTNLTPKDENGNYLQNEDPFFEQLGFSYEDLVPSDAGNLFELFSDIGDEVIVEQGVVHQANFLSHTTKNFYGISALSDTTNETTIGNYKISSNQTLYSLYKASAEVGYAFVQSQVTDEIYASSVPISSNTNAGHYLIELITSYQNEYLNDEDQYQVKAVVGNYFLSGDSFAMSMGPDSYIYSHMGIPITLTNIKVRILNPITKEPLSDIGPNSTIYLQIYKEIKAEEDAPPDEKNPRKKTGKKNN